jgi:hypothetical protein
MADLKISQLPPLAQGDLAADDQLAIVDTSGVATKKITPGALTGGSISLLSTGAIPVAKIAYGTARQLLQTNAGATSVEWASDIDVPGTLDVTGIATFDDNVIIQGDLTVNGTTTTIDTQTLLVQDKNIEMGVVTTPTDLTADGGGITLKGATDKTINWLNATGAWTSSEDIDLALGKSYYINGSEVLSEFALGIGVTGSSLASVGTITTGVWEGTAIDAAYLDSTVVTTNDTGTVTSTMIADDTIVDADISVTADIAVSKLAYGISRQILQTNAAGTGVEWTDNVEIFGTLDVWGAAVFNSTVSIDEGTY